VFLDRDGVLVRSDIVGGKPFATTSSVDFEILDEAPGAVARLKALGFVTIVATNQPDLATGKLALGELNAMHETLKSRMPLDDILVCPHVDADRCNCRKPKPGLLVDGARNFDLDLAACFMVGDRWRDVEAGRAAGCTTIFIDRGYSENMTCLPDHVVADVNAAADVIAQLGRANAGEKT
jgi:D-glycero-D-manno-heptose 1,7-bisphosphate phosphatase